MTSFYSPGSVAVFDSLGSLTGFWQAGLTNWFLLVHVHQCLVGHTDQLVLSKSSSVMGT